MDIINGIVNDIRSAIGNVISAVSSVASTIRSYLHFSVPDVGPLTDFQSWMPDFMNGLAEGIEGSKSVVKDAVKGLAADMVVSPQMRMDQSSLVSAIKDAVSGGNTTQGSGDIMIPVYLCGTILDEMIVNARRRANLRS